MQSALRQNPGVAPLLILLCLLAGGCRTYQYQYDNPGIRNLQAASLADTTNRVAGGSLERFFGPRTRWILPHDSALVTGTNPEAGSMLKVGGRAAAISHDGYYLTAYHLVEDATPVMVLPPTANSGKSIRRSLGGQNITFSHGRLVRHFKHSDIALIKFQHQPRAYFSSFQHNPARGMSVFTGATDGFIFGDDKLGNGPFQARGEISRFKRLKGSNSGTRIITTLVARGGMSGAPVADSEGNLVGILVRGVWSFLTSRPISSDCEIISPAEIEEAIEADRQMGTLPEATLSRPAGRSLPSRASRP